MKGFSIAFKTTDPEQGLDFIRRSDPDLLLTDVKMPKINGLAITKELKKSKTRVILMSGYIEYAVDGFDLEVLDYLHKPIRFKRFRRALKKVKQNVQSVEQKNSDLYLFGRSKPYGPYEPLLKSKISYIKGAAEYLEIFTEDKSFFVKTNFDDLLAKLSDSKFFRTHKSYIVNLDFLKSIASDKVTLKDDTQVPIGRSFKNNLSSLIHNSSLD
jgi:DNA-binding LytR/AlgR family response regulator